MKTPAGKTKPESTRKPAATQLEDCWRKMQTSAPGTPGKSLCQGEGQMKMMVLPTPTKGDGAFGIQPDQASSSFRLASSSSLSLEEEL
jgi:hypothetical protein